MNILVDMNLPEGWVDFLTGAGCTAVHWSEEGAPTSTDRAVMQWAAERGYAVLTAGLEPADIRALAVQNCPSVILTGGGQLTPEALGGELLAALHQHRDSLDAGAILSVDGNGAPPRIESLR